MKFCSKNDQISKGLIKALNHEYFIEFREDLGVSRFASRERIKTCCMWLMEAATSPLGDNKMKNFLPFVDLPL